MTADHATRVALGIEYDGSDFCGWQVQPATRTVQGTVETALARVADAQVSTICAGRTDTGVHAWSQIIHFDPPQARPLQAFLQGTNAHLPADVRVVFAHAVTPQFHARFGALARTYRYIILNRPQSSALSRKRALWVRNALDTASMHDAAQVLVGEHDFSAFRAASCQAPNPIRTVSAIDVRRAGPWVHIDITANAFLQNMVRIVVGSLVRIGRGDASSQWLAEALAACDRGHRGATAPPHGLYFASVRYESKFGLPQIDIANAPQPATSIIMAP